MPPRKRKDPAQPSLEAVTDEPVKTKTSRKGKLDQPVVQDGAKDELFRKRKAAKTGQPYSPKDTSKADPPAEDTKPGRQDTAGKSSAKQEEAPSTFGASIEINRAPVLTLWVAAVAEREGFEEDSALTFGKAISGLLAQAKGRSIGVMDPQEKEEADSKDKEDNDKVKRVDVFGMTIKAVEQDGKVLATDKGTTAIKPATVVGYLKRAFGARLDDAKQALQGLAASFAKEDIGSQAYHLYEQFRPQVPQGQAGWGKKGQLELDRIQELHAKA